MELVKSCIWCVCICSLVLIMSCWLGLAAEPNDKGVAVVKVGVVVDSTTRIGKEQMVGIDVATQEFNKTSKNLKISLHYGGSSTMDPLQAANSAMKLIKEKNVEAIIGTQNGQEASLLGEIGDQFKVPILSLATTPSSSPLPTKKSSFLVKMSNNFTAQMSCIASLVMYHQWKKVVAIYEDDGYDSGTSLMLDQLSRALQDVGSEIEYQLVLPPMDLMTNPKEMMTQELIKVLNIQSRVFIVLDLSLPVAIHLFKEANNVGLMGRETAWIITDSIASLLNSVNSSSISYMEGTLGIKAYYSEFGNKFKDFKYNFLLNFLQKYPQDSFQFGIHAIRAYDAITIITKTIPQLKSNYSPDELLQGILETKFNGFSGNISFKNGELEENIFRIVNIVGKTYKELDFWSSKSGFRKEISHYSSKGNNSYNEVLQSRVVYWPGDIDHIPRGWNMPINTKPLKIGVPGRTAFEKFVKVENIGNNGTTFSGFCIDIFLEVVKIIEKSYALPYEFEAFDGTYDELVDCVYNKTYDAVIGDVTILANRSKKVEFTQPYIKSALSMMVELKSKESEKAFLFLKPFSWQMWLVSIATLLYTMAMIWFLERRNNPNFGGSWRNQFSAAFWFTFTSIFFAHRENVHNNFTRITVVVWLFVVFVLTSSYAANLTSMLTVPLLKPKIKDYKKVVESNLKVGCDGDSFVREYLVNVLGFQPHNIINVSSEYFYPEFFENQSIAAAFIEHPYASVFLHQYCKKFTKTKDYFRFEGQGFVFPKGSPLAADVSKAILKLSENGVLKMLNDKWLSPSLECLSSSNSYEVESLSLKVFWILYLFTSIVSTFCFFVFIYRLLKGYRRVNQGNASNVEDQSLWNSIMRFAQYYHENVEGTNRTSERALNVANTPPSNTQPEDEWVAIRGYDSPTTPAGELEMSTPRYIR